MTKPARMTWKAGVLALLLFIATAGVAFAATMTLNGGRIGTGSLGTGCQTSTITSSWVLTYDAGVPGYTVTGVTLDGLQAGCLDRVAHIVVADAAGTQVTSGTAPTPDSGTSATVTFDTPFTMGSTWLRQVTVVVYV